MLGFILGTKEGKKILSLVNKFTDNIAVSTATKYGGELLNKYKYKSLNTNPLNKEEMREWINENEIKILIDGSHPYAAEVTKNAMELCDELKIEYVRYERKGVLEYIEGEDIIRVRDYKQVLECLKDIKGNVLNTTGGNNANVFCKADFDYRVIHRVLPMPKILTKLIDNGIKIADIIAIQGPVTYDLERAFIKHYNIKALITKDSGDNGGAYEKFKAARECGAKIIIIEKPHFTYKKVFYSEEDLVNYLKLRSKS